MCICLTENKGRTSEILEVVGDGSRRLGSLLLGRRPQVVVDPFLLEVTVDGLAPLALGTDEVEGRVHPVLHHELPGFDLASAARVDVLRDGLLSVPAEAALLCDVGKGDIKSNEKKFSSVARLFGYTAWYQTFIWVQNMNAGQLRHNLATYEEERRCIGKQTNTPYYVQK